VGGTTDTIDLGRLGLSSGEGAKLTPAVAIDAIELGGQRYTPSNAVADARLDVSHTTTGYALRLRFDLRLDGPCMRCLEAAGHELSVEAREVDQPGGGEDLRSPYLDGDELDVRSWARDALVLALPTRILCSSECRGLCGVCGANLNEDPEHAHEREPDPRWAKLSELKLD
jgi:DUF177 domain-containing protein